MAGETPRAGGGDSTNHADAVSRQTRWLEFWAHATSPPPVGLGLAPETLWALSWREFEALQRQWENYHRVKLERWAIERAQFANALLTRKDGSGWYPEDFLPDTPENRKRKQMRTAERAQIAKDEADVALLNARLNRMRPGDPEPEGLPEWARKRKA